MKDVLRLARLYRPFSAWVALSLGMSLMTLSANMILMAATGWFITAMAMAGTTGGALNYFVPAAIIRASAILRTAGRYLERLVAHETTFRLLERLRVWLFERIELVPIFDLDALRHADVANRLRSDVDRLETVFLRIFSPILTGVAACVILLAFLAHYAFEFALAEGVALAIAGFAVPLLLLRLTSRWSRRQVELSNQLNEQAVETVQGLAELLTFGSAKDLFTARFLATNREMADIQLKQGAVNGLKQAVLVLSSNLALLGVLALGIPLAQEGLLEKADLILVCLLSLAGFEAVAQLPQAFGVFGKAGEAARRVFSLADMQVAPLQPDPIPERREKCDISVLNLSFRYGSDAPLIFEDFEMALPQGRRVAITAPTGTGKSTLVGLLTGFLQPQQGGILLNGRDLQSYDPESLRRNYAVSFQQDGLFTGTIRENLLLARPSSGDADLWRVLQAAQLRDFVSELPEGLDTYIGKAGMALSGGQARRLSVARALLKDAKVLILDEPGEGLDYRTERALLRSVVGELKGRSLLLITHRKAGLEMMDEVIALEGGGAPDAPVVTTARRKNLRLRF